MNIGIVSEYNPFHNGHKYHIDESRKTLSAEAVVAVMSGSFVQRGEPAVFDKWTRAKAALLNGVDLVIELPAVYSCASAEYFASTAVGIMERSGIVDCISFGSESGDLDGLAETARIMNDETDEFKAALRKRLDAGDSYPLARAKAFDVCLTGPNDILAVEYLRVLNREKHENYEKHEKSRIKPFTVKRWGSGYHDTEMNSGFPSATAVRKALAEGLDIDKAVPENVLELYRTSPRNCFDNYVGMLKYIVAAEPGRLAEIFDVSEGLENRIADCVNKYQTISEIVAVIKSKRYTYTKIQRILTQILLNITIADMEMFRNDGGAKYIRVLGFRKEKEGLVSELTRKSAVPVIMNLKKDERNLNGTAKRMLAKDTLAADIFNIGIGRYRSEYESELIIL